MVNLIISTDFRLLEKKLTARQPHSMSGLTVEFFHFIRKFSMFWWYLGLIYRHTSNQGFPKVDHSGINARIVLEQINAAKKTTSNRTWTLDPRTVCTAHFLSLTPYHCARSHCLKDWDFNDPYVVMLYWFLDLEELRGFSWNQKAWLYKDH